MSKKIIAIVPMRHNSERINGKNYRNFVDKPLFFYIINTLLKCKSITDLIIDTDSPLIMDLVVTHFKSVILRERPFNLRDGLVPMNDVLLDIINDFPSDFYLQTHCTNPLLQADTIEKAINKYLSLYPMYDSLFSVTKKNVRLWDSLSRPINHNNNILLRTQDLPPIYEENSCLYLFTRDILINKHNRIGDRPFMFEIPEIESQDIDVELNFKVAEFLYSQIHSK